MNTLKKMAIRNQQNWLNLDIKPKAIKPHWEKTDTIKTVEKINIIKAKRRKRKL